jgi:hypothetical protein
VKHVRKAIPIVYMLIVALFVVGPVAASIDTGAAQLTSSSEGASTSADACALSNRSGGPSVRLRCDVDEVPDPRVGTSATASVFFGVCEQGEPDDQCDVRISQPVARTGAEGRDDLQSLEVEMNDPTQVCVPFVGCHTVYKPSGRFRATVFDADGPAEAEVWAPSGSQAAADPGEVCVRNGGYGAPCGGQTGNGDASISGSPADWVSVTP